MADDSHAARFEGIYRGAYARLVGQLTVVTTSRAEAEEVVQEAFCRLWERWEKVEGYDDIEAWVRRVAFNAAIGRWRRHRRHTALVDLPAAADPTGSGVEILVVLARLPPRQRAALYLHHVLGLSVEEVAGELSAKTGTVKSWLHRGRAALEDGLRVEAGEVGRP